MLGPKVVPGRELGLDFPPTIEALQAAGPEFLTSAFHASGILPVDNAVVGITEFKEFFGGGMGRKLWLGVQYAKQDPAISGKLFVKFPRDFGDPLRELFGPLMEPEVQFALLSRTPGFPIDVPRCYFADYDPGSTSGILITERIAYGTGTIEACHDKCLDYLVPDPAPHYEALTETMARLAAFHKSGKLRQEIEALFPFTPGKLDPGSRIPYTPEQLQEKLAKLLDFAQRVPQLMEPQLADPAFLADFVKHAPLVLAQEQAIRDYLDGDPDYVTLCHWNMNLDNAWFYRENGALHAGLLDWGSVAQMNLAQAYYGMICSAETDFMNKHRDALLARLVKTYQTLGGPKLSSEKLTVMVKLAIAVLGIAWILDAPTLVEREIPDYETLTDRYDPKIRDIFLARAQLQLLQLFLNEWRAMNISGAIADFAAGSRV